ncbi:hypothetical protein SK128_007283 [Halocaridina rubra]|uniref:Carbohydrate sulfotransferase n=1 Tax=Halocaridina rubra TaxID=373956 RepID=A0AAN9AC80_HALRR
MKVMRLRFRGVTVLGIAAAVTVVFLYLPPVYRSNLLVFTKQEPLAAPAAAFLQAEETKRTVESPANGRNASATTPPGNQFRAANILPPAPPPKAWSETLDKIIKSAETDGEHSLANANENDHYIQDYPDYTPPNFIDVKKTNPKDVGHVNKRPARLKSEVPTSAPMATFSPEALRNRAMSFHGNSTLRAFLNEQDRRSRHISETCPSIFPPVDVDSKAIGPPPGLSGLQNLLLDRIQHIAYCPVYKAASTSWTITLLEIGGYWNSKVRKNRKLQTLVGQVFPKVSNFAGPALTRSMTRFMVVRHPFERLLSCYRDKFEDAKKTYYYTRYGEKMVRNYRRFPSYITPSQLSMLQEQVRAKVKAGVPVKLPGNPFAKPLGPTFPEFVAYILHAKHDDEHWRTYYDHCSPCHMDYHVILRFENMFEEGKVFIEYLNRTAKVNMRWENPTEGGTTTNDVICSYYNQLSTEYIKELYLKYEKDFKLFEYKPDKYYKCASDYKMLSKNTTQT